MVKILIKKKLTITKHFKKRYTRYKKNSDIFYKIKKFIERAVLPEVQLIW